MKPFSSVIASVILATVMADNHESTSPAPDNAAPQKLGK
jgi:hypothetical protein